VLLGEVNPDLDVDGDTDGDVDVDGECRKRRHSSSSINPIKRFLPIAQ
jgi:hypothetical protein